ncbi:hypothetical protein SSX86_006564 [Deinandra increscens subsp. villosa]|uniref:non-specific serine/threonine protein kinase n=1 Tax=Deinandra increscens subsp. villosa TaxID=3103831 RepID=A0AAP0DIY4_9ASTR
MGLPLTSTPDSASSPFVAVEFDTFSNDWDPRIGRGIPIGDHVAIDLSSVSSVKSQKWFTNVTGKGVCEAWIRYDSVSKDLSVSFTGFQNNTVVRQDGLVYTVDLKKELPERVVFGFSGATGAMFRGNTLRSWSFESSDLVADKNNTVKAGNSKVGLIVGLTVIITSLGLLVLVIGRRKKKNTKDVSEQNGFDVEMNKKFEIGSRPKQFSYIELAQSTDDFAEENKLGEGGLGRVYRGFLKDSNAYIAVERVSKSSEQEIKKYAAKVRIISQLRHKNLVQLTGWCHEKGELLFVYDYMENGSLDWHLFKAKSLLTWSARYKIANGLASALWYIHEGWEQCVLHRDVRSSKVLLDSNFNAKLGDFRLAKLVDHDKDSQTMTLARKAAKESDVFSFGVIALELACGKKPIEHKEQEKQIQLIEWVWELYGSNTLIEAVDPSLGSDFEVEEIKGLMVIGLWCMHPYSELRPSMRQVIQVLNHQASLPVLPSMMPTGSYLMSRVLSVLGVGSIIHNLSSSGISTQVNQSI